MIMNRFFPPLLGILTMCWMGCQPTIDASTEESMTISVAEIKQALDEEKKAQFEASLAIVLLDGMNFEGAMQAAFRGEEFDAEAAADSIQKTLDGMTADDVIARADAIQAERAAELKARVKEELDELLAKKAAAAEAKRQLALFKISDARFYKRKEGTYYITEQPIIQLTVTNGTQIPVSHAYFTGTLQSPGRSVPWIKEDFNYAIAGGMEPGESDSWKLAPNQFSDWGSAEAPSDAIFTVEAVRLDGPEGAPALDASGFTEDDEKRVAEIYATYPDFKP